MMEQAGVIRASVCVLAAVWMTAVYAQEEAQPAAADGQAPAAVQQEESAKTFMPMVRLIQVRGKCEALNPDVGSYAPAIENKVYPLGTSFRTGPESLATLVFSGQESVQLASSTEVCVGTPDKQPDNRVLRLVAGTIKTSLRENLPEGSFSVCTPNAVSKNVEGRGEYTLFTDAVTETLQIATITGAACIEGSHYHIPALRAANTVNIQTSVDRSFSRLTSVSGDFVIILNKGEEEPVNYGMSPKAVVKIWRENAPVGGRPVIAALVVSPTGIAKHRFAYAEGRSGVATGELVQPVAEEDEEDLPVLLSKDSEKEKKEEEAEKNEASTEQ
ncbi:MAG TPA: hypothetical protein P5527_10260 [Kiritimatiellia bacterium]|nr:hypothetical protein [Kiritimatiellia bacterium]